MSFRQFGGINYAARHNVVGSNYNTSNNLLVTQNIGQPNSYINFQSDISGNIHIYGNLDVSGNTQINGNLDITGNTQMNGNLDVTGNTTAYYMFLSSGNNYNENPNALMPKSYIDLVSTGVNPLGQVNVISTNNNTQNATFYPVPIDQLIDISQYGGQIEIDGYELEANDNVLLNDQSDQVNNGVYVYTNIGGSIYKFTRSTEILPEGYDAKGAYLSIVSGIKYGRTGWIQTNSNNLDLAIVGQDDLIFKDFYNLNFRLGQGLFGTEINDITYINVNPQLDFLTLLDASSSNPSLDIGTTNAISITMGQSDGSTSTTINGTLGVTSDASIGGILEVTSNASIGGTLGVTSNASIGGTLGVTQTSTLTGNVGIGTTPSSYNGITFPSNTTTNGYGITWGGEANYSRIYDNVNLHIYTDDDMYFDTGDYPGTTKLYIQANTGYVGISNTSPSYNLDVTGTLRVTSNATIGGTLNVNDIFQVFNSGVDYINIFDKTVNGNYWYFNNSGEFGYWITGSSPGSSAWTISKNGNATIGGSLQVSEGTVLNDTLQVLNGTTLVGNLSVSGTTTINNNLSVSNGASISGTTTMTNAIVSGYFQPSFGNTNSNGIKFQNSPVGSGDNAWIRYYLQTGDNCLLELGIGNDAGDNIYLNPSGGVGIRTNSPQYTLDVNGNARISSNFVVNANTIVSGYIQPSIGYSDLNGIQFPNNPGGGLDDTAWIRYYALTGEKCLLEIGIGDNSLTSPYSDSIYLNPSGGVGICTNTPEYTLDVSGNVRVTANAVFGKFITGESTEYFNVTISSNNIGTYGSGLTGNASIQLSGNNDYALINYVSSIIDQGYLQIGTGDNGTEPIYITTANGNIGYPNMRIDSGAVWINPSGDGNFPNTISNYGLNVNGQVTATLFQSSSDYRLKTNIKQINDKYSIDSLNPIEYDINNRHDMGFLAHEIQEHYPFLVDGEKDGEKMQSINYNGLIALLVKEIQGLKNEIKELKHKI
jgi:hypothetical protein